MATLEEYQSQQEVSFALSDLLAFLWGKKFRILFSCLLITFLGAYYVVHLPKLYMASATLLLSEDGGTAVGMPNLPGFSSGSAGKLDTHIEFIKSNQFLRSIVEKLQLQNHAEFFPIKGPSLGKPDIEHTIEVVKEDLKLSVLRNTDMLKVSFISRTPQIATDVVNQIGPSFFAFQALRSREKAVRASQWLNDQIQNIKLKLVDSESRLQEFLQVNKLVDVASQIHLVQNQITALMREEMINNKLLAEAKFTVDQINAYADSPANLINVTSLHNNAMVTELRKQILLKEQELAEISRRYKSKHNKYIAVVSVLGNLKKELVVTLQQQALAQKLQYQSLLNRQALLEKQLETGRLENNELAKLEITQTKLKKEVESNQKLFEALLTRLQETEVLKDLSQKENYAVVEYANLPARPFQPKIAVSVVVIFILSMVFSIGFWLFLHLLSDRKTRYRKLLRSIDVNVLAEIPKPAKPRKKGLKNVVNEHNFAFSEAIRSLRTAVLVNPTHKQTRIIALTSVQQNDDKSNIAISLAESFCNMERTLLMDLELRTPVIGKAFGLSEHHPGITDFISRRAKFADILHREPNVQLGVLPGGTIPGDPMLYLSKSRLSGFINKLAVLYERLIIDTPPVNTVGDTLVISKYVDGIILVCDIEKVESEQLLEAIQRLQDSGAPLMGVVFNRVKTARRRRV